MGEIFIQNFGRKTREMRPLRRPRLRCVDNIRMDLRIIGWECVDWMHLAQDRDYLYTLQFAGHLLLDFDFWDIKNISQQTKNGKTT
jgi:hypothetical protein